MSPRAACRLEALGFSDVYDYTAGKADWLAAGLPTEGPGAAKPRPGRLARAPVPTCSLTDSIATARQRVAAAGEDRCVVVSGTGIILGLLDHRALAGDGEANAVDLMSEGPTTVRAHEDLGALARRMHDRNVDKVVVSDADGRLIGLLHHADADAALGRRPGAGGRGGT